MIRVCLPKVTHTGGTSTPAGDRPRTLIALRQTTADVYCNPRQQGGVLVPYTPSAWMIMLDPLGAKTAFGAGSKLRPPRFRGWGSRLVVLETENLRGASGAMILLAFTLIGAGQKRFLPRGKSLPRPPRPKSAFLPWGKLSRRTGMVFFGSSRECALLFQIAF